jgi:hypothetical protein
MLPRGIAIIWDKPLSHSDLTLCEPASYMRKVKQLKPTSLNEGSIILSPFQQPGYPFLIEYNIAVKSLSAIAT